MLTVNEALDQVFGYLGSFSVFPEASVPAVKEIIDSVFANGGPKLDFVKDEQAGGYVLSYHDVVYTEQNKQDLYDLLDNDEAYSSDGFIYGTLSNRSVNTNYSAFSVASRIVEESILRGRAHVEGTASSRTAWIRLGILAIEFVEGSEIELPIIRLRLSNTGDAVDLVPDKATILKRFSSFADIDDYQYINFQIAKGDGDMIMKIMLSTTPLSGGDQHVFFDAFSINQYNTEAIRLSNSDYVYEDIPPTVHHCMIKENAGFAGGIGLVQYDAGSAKDVTISGTYDIGALLMNTSGAPLMLVTSETKDFSRSSTTSLYSIHGDYNETVGFYSGEKLQAPSKRKNASIIIAPFFSPSSGRYISVRSGWACEIDPDSEAFSSVAIISPSGGYGTTFRCDHGFCLSGGALE